MVNEIYNEGCGPYISGIKLSGQALEKAALGHGQFY